MKEQTRERKQKVILPIAAGLLALAIAVTGTLAYASITKSAKNKFEGFINSGVRLHNDYEGEINREQNPIDVYAENYGETSVYVRLRLSEFFSIGNDILMGEDKDDPSTWDVHYEGRITPAQKYWEWQLGGQKWYLPTDNVDDSSPDPDNIFERAWYDEVDPGDLETRNYARDNMTPLGTGTVTRPFDGSEAGTIWTDNVFERIIEIGPPTVAEYTQKTIEETALSDGSIITYAAWEATGFTDIEQWVYEEVAGMAYYYWGKHLAPGETTGLFLNEVNRLHEPYEDYFYDINVELQASNDLDGFGFQISGTHGISYVHEAQSIKTPVMPAAYDMMFAYETHDAGAGVVADWTILEATGSFTSSSLIGMARSASLKKAAKVILTVPADATPGSHIKIEMQSTSRKDFHRSFTVEVAPKMLDSVLLSSGGETAAGATNTKLVTVTDEGYYAVLLRGASGGSSNVAVGGQGGWVKTVQWLTPGEYLMVAGATAAGVGYIGGGAKGSSYGSNSVGSGGGLSGLFSGNLPLFSNIIAIAAGGGGAGGRNNGSHYTGGGNGAGATGDGVTVMGTSGGSSGSGGEYHTAGGGGGTGGGGGGTGDTNGNGGGQLYGGFGVRYSSGSQADGSGGGGSGYYGGGSGGSGTASGGSTRAGGGGGGGSSYVKQNNGNVPNGLVATAVNGNPALPTHIQTYLNSKVPTLNKFDGGDQGFAYICYLGKVYPTAELYPPAP